MFDPFRHFLHVSDNMLDGGRHVGRVVGNIPDSVWVAGGLSGGLSGIFPTQFGLRAVCREGRREYSRPSLGGARLHFRGRAPCRERSITTKAIIRLGNLFGTYGFSVLDAFRRSLGE
jgi:hypothetical protein